MPTPFPCASRAEAHVERPTRPPNNAGWAEPLPASRRVQRRRIPAAVAGDASRRARREACWHRRRRAPRRFRTSGTTSSRAARLGLRHRQRNALSGDFERLFCGIETYVEEVGAVAGVREHRASRIFVQRRDARVHRRAGRVGRLPVLRGNLHRGRRRRRLVGVRGSRTSLREPATARPRASGARRADAGSLNHENAGERRSPGQRPRPRRLGHVRAPEAPASVFGAWRTRSWTAGRRAGRAGVRHRAARAPRRRSRRWRTRRNAAIAPAVASRNPHRPTAAAASNAPTEVGRDSSAARHLRPGDVRTGAPTRGSPAVRDARAVLVLSTRRCTCRRRDRSARPRAGVYDASGEPSTTATKNESRSARARSMNASFAVTKGTSRFCPPISMQASPC